MPKFDEDELLCGYQNDKNKEAKEQKQMKAQEAARKREADTQAAKAAAYYAKQTDGGAGALGKTVKFAPTSNPTAPGEDLGQKALSKTLAPDKNDKFPASKNE